MLDSIIARLKASKIFGSGSSQSDESDINNPGPPRNTSPPLIIPDQARLNVQTQFAAASQSNTTDKTLSIADRVSLWRNEAGHVIRTVGLKPNHLISDLHPIEEEDAVESDVFLEYPEPEEQNSGNSADFLVDQSDRAPLIQHQSSNSQSENRQSWSDQLSHRLRSEGGPFSPIVDGNKFEVVSLGVMYHEYSSRYNPSIERQRCLALMNEMCRSGWSGPSIELFYKINMRGFESLVPHHWALDFGTWPDVLFTPQGGKPYIKSRFLSDFHAIRSLARLTQVGPKIRDVYQTEISRLSPEDIFSREMIKYRDWAFADSRSNRASPSASTTTTVAPLSLLEIVIGKTEDSVDVLAQVMLQKLDALGQMWKRKLTVKTRTEALQNIVGLKARPTQYVTKIPTLYGIIASGLIFAIVCYETPLDPAPSVSPSPRKNISQEMKRTLKAVIKREKKDSKMGKSPSRTLAVPEGVRKRSSARQSSTDWATGSTGGHSKSQRSVSAHEGASPILPLPATMSDSPKGRRPRPSHRHSPKKHASTPSSPAKVVIDHDGDDGIQRGCLRTIGVFDFSNPGYDVWNALAVAILIVHVRNRMVELAPFSGLDLN